MKQKNQLRICTYNIHKGFSTSNRKFLLHDIRHAIRMLDSDFVFLQEVMGENNGKRGNSLGNQFEYLADSIWHHHAYGQNAIYDNGHHGNAILSKYPFIEHKNIDVSQMKVSQRGLLIGKTENGIYLLCVHLGLFSLERRIQLSALIKLVKKEVPKKAPLIIAGDFNDWNLDIHRKITEQLKVKEAYSTLFEKPAKTFPSKFPLLAMDRIYYRNLELVDAEVLSGKPWSRLSDHCALAAIFAVPGVKGSRPA
jgi:endonuclease/exonuclease/phosphatase family metal-dependent hydrolase